MLCILFEIQYQNLLISFHLVERKDLYKQETVINVQTELRWGYKILRFAMFIFLRQSLHCR